MNDTEGPDPRLQAALRAAPDADLQAPPELGARILDAARAAVQADTRSQRLRSWFSGWAVRPLGASGALATVLLGTVIALLWQHEPEQTASPTPMSAAENRPTGPAPAPAAAPAMPGAATPPTADAALPSSPVRSDTPRAKTAPPPRVTTQSAPAEPQRAPEAERAMTRPGPEAPAALAGPAPPPAPPAPSASPAPVIAEAASAGLGAMASPAAAARVRGTSEAAVAPGPTDDTHLPPTQAAWLRALRAQAAGRWQAVAPGEAPAADPFASQPPVDVTIGDQRVRWCERPAAATPRCWVAPLTPAEQQHWLQSRPR